MEYSHSFDSLGAQGGTISALDEPERANAALDSLMDAGPAPEPPVPAATTFTLPIGYVDADGTWHREARVRELTGADEEEMMRAGTNPFRYFDSIIRCGTAFVGEHPATESLLRRLPVPDRDTLILAIRIATFGPQYTWESWQCPHCTETTDLTFGLDTIEITEPPLGQREYAVQLRGGLQAVLRYPTGEDQAALFADESMTTAQQNSLMISRCLVSIADRDGNALALSPQTGRTLGMADRKAILKAMEAHRCGPHTDDIKVVHEACGQEATVPLPLVALFR